MNAAPMLTDLLDRLLEIEKAACYGDILAVRLLAAESKELVLQLEREIVKPVPFGVHRSA